MLRFDPIHRPRHAVGRDVVEGSGAVSVVLGIRRFDVVEDRLDLDPAQCRVGQPVQVVLDHPLEENVVLS